MDVHVVVAVGSVHSVLSINTVGIVRMILAVSRTCLGPVWMAAIGRGTCSAPILVVGVVRRIGLIAVGLSTVIWRTEHLIRELYVRHAWGTIRRLIIR